MKSELEQYRELVEELQGIIKARDEEIAILETRLTKKPL